MTQMFSYEKETEKNDEDKNRGTTKRLFTRIAYFDVKCVSVRETRVRDRKRKKIKKNKRRRREKIKWRRERKRGRGNKKGWGFLASPFCSLIKVMTQAQEMILHAYSHTAA